MLKFRINTSHNKGAQRKLRTFVAVVGALLALPGHAAPSDGLLSAHPEQGLRWGFIEINTDHMNQSLDIFRVRESDPLTAGTKTGDYKGLHIDAGLRATDKLWLSGSFWQRSIKNAVDTFHYNSWQVSGQYRLLEAQSPVPAVAIRLSAWGNYANETASSTPVTVPGAILNSVKITSPADRQLQADLIGTWNLSPRTDLSALVSVGSSKLSYGALNATTTRNGCNYQLSFNGNDIFGTLAQPCAVAGGVIQQFYDRSGDYGVDVAKEIAWRAVFVQTGVNATWRTGAWTLKSGYVFHAVRRDSVDAILAARGKASYSKSHKITLEAGYQINEWLTAIARAQLSTHFLLSDMPVTYNSATAERFAGKYSVFALGLRANF